jgi:hypothetical protein
MTHHSQSGDDDDGPATGAGLTLNSSFVAAATPSLAAPELPGAEPVTTMSLR